MKITEFKGTKENINVFKPIAGLMLHLVQADAKVRVRMIDSDTGATLEVVPSIPVQMLAEFSTYGEGSFMSVKDVQNEYLTAFIKLSDDAVALSNNRYLSVDVIQPKQDGAACIVYGIESTNAPVSFFYRYNTVYVSAGELIKSFHVGDQEFLAIPLHHTSANDAIIDEVQLYTKNGTSPVYTERELRFIAQQNNDIVKVNYDSAGSTIVDGSSALWCILDLTEVVSFDIKYLSNPKGTSVVMVDSKDVNRPVDNIK